MTGDCTRNNVLLQLAHPGVLLRYSNSSFDPSHPQVGFVREMMDWESQLPYDDFGTYKDLFNIGIFEKNLVCTKEPGDDGYPTADHAMGPHLKNGDIITFEMNLKDGTLSVTNIFKGERGIPQNLC